MSIRVAIHHETTYQYDRTVNLGPQVVRLRPAPHCRTKIVSYSMRAAAPAAKEEKSAAPKAPKAAKKPAAPKTAAKKPAAKKKPAAPKAPK